MGQLVGPDGRPLDAVIEAGPTTEDVAGTAAEQEQPHMNRAQRRQAERAAKRAQAKRTPRNDRVEQGAAMLMQAVMMNRWDAVNRVIGELFERDELAGLWRLKGLGGPTGVLQDEQLEQAANGAISSGVLLPGTGGEQAMVEAVDAVADAQAEAATEAISEEAAAELAQHAAIHEGGEDVTGEPDTV